MANEDLREVNHPMGEVGGTDGIEDTDHCTIDSYAGKVLIRWDETAAVTTMGQMPVFVDFLEISSLAAGADGKYTLFVPVPIGRDSAFPCNWADLGHRPVALDLADGGDRDYWIIAGSVDADGNIYLLDWFYSRLLRIGSDGSISAIVFPSLKAGLSRE